MESNEPTSIVSSAKYCCGNWIVVPKTSTSDNLVLPWLGGVCSVTGHALTQYTKVCKCVYMYNLFHRVCVACAPSF